jgi:ribosomal protein S25
VQRRAAVDPNAISPIEKEIDPDRVVSSVEVTDAVKYTTSFAAKFIANWK